MAPPKPRMLYVATFLALGNLLPASADSLPEPPEPLKDYQGRGVLQVIIPSTRASVGDGTKVVDPGLSMSADIFQAYVWPDRSYVALEAFGARQVFLTLGNAGVEKQWSPGASYVITRTYKNLDKDTASPMMGVQLSMATYAKVLREIKTLKLLPDEDFDQRKAANEARIAELEKQRSELDPRRHPDHLAKFNEVSGEMARLREDIKQMELRRKRPCHIVEVRNTDLISSLLSAGLMGPRVRERLEKGKSTFWVTKNEGLPIRMESTDSDGRVALYFCLLDFKINSGLVSGDLTLGAPRLLQEINVTADVKQHDWEGRMEDEINERIAQIEERRVEKNRPAPVQKPWPQPPPKRKKKR